MTNPDPKTPLEYASTPPDLNRDANGYLIAPEPTTRMPRCIPFIVANEFAERFSFYGMKAILVVFMTQYMITKTGAADHLSKDDANIWMHNFNSFVYFTPLLGSLLADIFWGKYRTIFWVSLLYCVGHGVLAAGETRTHLLIGLTLIGLGAGGIKPCVSANVGDQFGKSNEHLLSQIYNWFYFSINLGAFLAQMMIPSVLEKWGPRWAFGIPGILMGMAALVFWLGRKQYVHRPAQGLSKVMENFSGKNLLILVRLVAFFMLVAPFYALYDEGSGSWVSQAQYLNLDTHVPGLGVMLQSQVQSTNAILILVFIPLFAYGVYPLLGKVIKLTPQRKIGIGMMLLIPTFLMAWQIEKWVKSETQVPEPSQYVQVADPKDPAKTINGEKKSDDVIKQELKGWNARIDDIASKEGPSVWWQILAYAMLTAAEIMVSVPALEFAYTQAPPKMKSIIMAAYLAGSISFGNVIASVVVSFIKTEGTPTFNATHGDNSPNYYLVFVGLIAGAVMIYSIAAMLLPSKTVSIAGGEGPSSEASKDMNMMRE